MFDGIEVDVLSVGDADCIVVTQWQGWFAHRVLVDGGCANDADRVLEFLLSRGYTNFWAAVCTHPHNDHARGLIKIIESGKLTITNGWMHDIRNHFSTDILRRACADSDEVRQIVETTRELSSAFLSRNIRPNEPFVGACIAGFPDMTVLGPSQSFYKKIVQEFAGIRDGIRHTSLASLSGLQNAALKPLPIRPSFIPYRPPTYTTLTTLLPAPVAPNRSTSTISPLFGLLNKSSVKENPKTQPFNETSVLLGVRSSGGNLLLTGDAGSRALAFVPANWNHLLYMGVPHHASDGNLSQSDIERFCPRFAIISAKGDSSHPSRAIVNGLVKTGAKVASTHNSGNLWFWSGSVPARSDYNSVELLRGNVAPQSVVDWRKIAAAGAGLK
jgi:beta-lactamase superfamily II metal-dependent hydrolase